jgi:hypothetical protein
MAVLAAAAAIAVGGVTLATSASARDSFSVSIGVPGVAFGYSNYGVPYYAPPPVYAPAPAPYYYGPPVAYRPYYRPYYYRPHYYGPYAYYRH